VQFHDRSAICTAALAVYLGHPIPETLTDELDRIERESVYQRRVFFIRNLGFVAPTQARRISFEEALRFERIHEEIYRSFGYEIAFVEPGTLKDRVASIKMAALAGL
jgi:predicted ATPase